MDERIDNHHLCSTDEQLINAHLYLVASDVVARMCLNKSIETGVIHFFHPNDIWELTELLDRLARFSGTCIRTLPCYLEETRTPVAFSHDSQLMACVVDKKYIQLSRVYTREDVGIFEISGRDNVRSVAFLSLSSILAVMIVEATVKI